MVMLSRVAKNIGMILFLELSTLALFAQTARREPQLSYGQLPLTFEVNKGQSNPQVKFLTRAQGYSAFLTAGSLTLSLRVPQSEAPSDSTIRNHQDARLLQFDLAGAAAHPVIVGEDLQPGKANYFLGNDPAKWQRNVSLYGRVRYRDVYPGIDLVYYGNHRQLECDFEVKPGADPRQIRFAVRGSSGISLSEAGDLILKVGNDELRFQSPAVYQERNGRRVLVPGSYVLQDSSHVGFQISDFDANQKLVIDPVLVYSTYLGGSGDEQASGIAVDSTGNVYIAGYTDSANLPLTSIGTVSSNANHVFVAKLNAAGTGLVYADYVGGGNDEYGTALAIDSSNQVYVTGSTTSANFPTVNAYQSQLPGPYSGFLTKLSADGSSLLYSTYLGGNAFDQPTAVAVDNLGQAHVAGYTMSRNFPVSNAYQSTASPNQGGNYGYYGFLTKFANDGTSLVYSTYFAGSSNVSQDCGHPCWPVPVSTINALSLDPNGDAYVSGTTNTYNFPTTSGSYLSTNTTQQNSTVGFVSKFNSAGGLAYSTFLYGSSGNPVGMSAIAVDSTGAAYVTGSVISDGTFPVTSTSICDPSVYGFDCSYTFLTKFDPAGSTLLYSSFLGPYNYAVPQSLALDSKGNAYVLATTTSSSFQTSNAIESYSSQSDLLLLELDAGATTQLWSTYLGSSGRDFAAGLALDANSNIYVAGMTDGIDFPTTNGTFQTQSGGKNDAFVMKIASGSAASVSLQPGTLHFGSLAIASTSSTQTILLRNMGSSALTVSSVVTAGDFAATENCTGTVAAASSCTISVSFTPIASGTRTGSITINDNAPGGPHIVSLDGTGIGPAVTLAPATLAFPTLPVGTHSSAQIVTLENTSSSALNISSIQAAGDFSQTNDCPASLAVGTSCSMNVTFTPTSSGARAGTITITDSAPGSPQVISLSGTGSDFSISGAPNSQSIKAGGVATYTITVAAQSGTFSNAVALSCGSVPAHAICSISPGSAVPGSTSATVTMTISTTGSSAALRSSEASQFVYAAWMPAQGLGLFGMVLGGTKRRNRKSPKPVLLVLLVLALLFLCSCAGGTGIASSGQGISPGTYSVTVTGSSGSLQHATQISLMVQ